MAASITLAICTYNNSVLLDTVMATIERQAVHCEAKWSVLVVDNNSKDKTKNVVDRYINQRRIASLRYVFEPKQGLTHARQRAVLESDSEWIAFVDDDCELTSNWILEALQFVADHPKAGAVGGRVHLKWEVPPADWTLKYQHSLAHQDHGELPVRMPDKGFTWLVGAGLLLRREAVEVSGWLQEGRLVDRSGDKTGSGGDTEIVLRIRHAGYELWYNPAMKLNHFIPWRRMSLEHLCLVHRGVGRSMPFLLTLGENLEPTVRRRMYLLNSSLRGCARVLGRSARGLLLRQGVSPEEWINLYQALGRFEGSFLFLCNGY